MTRPESERAKKLKTLDDAQIREYLISRIELIEELKDRALFLAAAYGENIKIEIDVNPKVQSVKLSVKEFF